MIIGTKPKAPIKTEREREREREGDITKMNKGQQECNLTPGLCSTEYTVTPLPAQNMSV
jgi:hypothetical protein